MHLLKRSQMFARRRAEKKREVTGAICLEMLKQIPLQSCEFNDRLPIFCGSLCEHFLDCLVNSLRFADQKY